MPETSSLDVEILAHCPTLTVLGSQWKISRPELDHDLEFKENISTILTKKAGQPLIGLLAGAIFHSVYQSPHVLTSRNGYWGCMNWK